MHAFCGEFETEICCFYFGTIKSVAAPLIFPCEDPGSPHSYCL